MYIMLDLLHRTSDNMPQEWYFPQLLIMMSQLVRDWQTAGTAKVAIFNWKTIKICFWYDITYCISKKKTYDYKKCTNEKMQ